VGAPNIADPERSGDLLPSQQGNAHRSGRKVAEGTILEDPMPLLTSTSSSGPSETAAPEPPCPECAVALTAVGSGRHRYWTCRWCGTTMRRL
jgi:hypothetical protein